MAIDTVAKKLSLIDYANHWMGPMPLPTGSFDQADMQVFLAGYAGIEWTEVVGGVSSRKLARYIVPLID